MNQDWENTARVYKFDLERIARHVDLDTNSDPLEIIARIDEIQAELQERRDADAELGGTNSSIDDKRRAELFIQARHVAQQLQEKWIARGGKE